MKKTLEVGLIKGRHPLPVNEYIFDKIEDVLDFSTMRNTVDSFFKNIKEEPKEIIVYVTGLTAATATVIASFVTKWWGDTTLSFMHYDVKNGNYKKQFVVRSFSQED